MKTIWYGIKNYIRRTDWLLLILALVCTLIGLVLIYSARHATSEGAMKDIAVQVGAALVGIMAFVIASLVNFDKVGKFWPLIFAVNILFQLTLLKFGVGGDSTGNNSWLRFAGIGIQPGEVGKILFIFTFSQHINKFKETINSFKNVALLLLHLFVTMGAVYFTAGDLGNAVLYLFIALVMLSCSGISFKWIGGMLAGSIAMVPLMWSYVFKEYQKLRILVVFEPDLSPKYSYHARQSITAVRNGGLFGRGFLNGPQVQSGILPMAHNDFIFSVCAEEFGFVGCTVIIILLAAIVLRIFADSAKTTNTHEYLMCVGIGTMIMVQTLINIGMCLGVMPVIGLTLPFISYGGSSILTMITALGFVSGCASRRKPSWLRK